MEIAEEEGQEHKTSAMVVYKRITKLSWLQERGKICIAQLEVDEVSLSCIYPNSSKTFLPFLMK